MLLSAPSPLPFEPSADQAVPFHLATSRERRGVLEATTQVDVAAGSREPHSPPGAPTAATREGGTAGHATDTRGFRVA